MLKIFWVIKSTIEKNQYSRKTGLKFKTQKLSRVEGTKTDTLDSFYHNFYSFYTNKIGIILNIVFCVRLTLFTPFSPFKFQCIIFFFIFSKCTKVVQNRPGYENRDLEKNHTKFSKLIFICRIYKRTCWVLAFHSMYAHRSYSVHCIHFSLRPLDFENRSVTKCKECFFFLRGAVPMTVSESPSSSESALLCTSESLSLFFQYLFCIFLQCPFSCHCTICTKWENKKDTNYSRNS